MSARPAIIQYEDGSFDYLDPDDDPLRFIPDDERDYEPDEDIYREEDR